MTAASIGRGNRGLFVYAVAYLLFLYVPVMLLPLFSFNDSLYIAFPIKSFTIKWYDEMLHHDRLIASFFNSIKVATATSVVATAFGLLAAKAVTRYRLPGERPVVFTIMLPIVVPGIILATSLLILFNRIGLGLSLFAVTLGHILISVPFAMAVMIARFEGFDRSLEEASADLGENGWWTFWRVTFPIVFPGILSSLLLCFVISFDEFIMAFFLSSTEPTLPVFMYNQLRFPQKLPPVLAMGACIIVVSFVVVFLAEWIRRRGDSGRTPVRA